MPRLHRDDVFIAGGQPQITYVSREESHIERNLARALATPNQIVSLAGPTKSGKTVLCRKVLGEREYVWVDGGNHASAEQVWKSIASELNIPYERSSGTEKGGTLEAGVNTPILSAGGSRLNSRSATEAFQVDGKAESVEVMLENKIALVVDDFHYLPAEMRVEFVRNIKGAVFNGLKVVFLSVAHRVFDVISAESELTGRFISVTLPEWSAADLRKIPEQGFDALNVECSHKIIEKMAGECQSSPFLMQKFCWEICFDNEIEFESGWGKKQAIGNHLDLDEMFIRIAKDSGLPIYQRLVAGPQSRKERMKRPLRDGEDADIYEATLLALAETGPKSAVSYEELRAKLNSILIDNIPQKHEITSALKHLASISQRSGSESAIDWDEEKREISLADPYLRFYLRWQVRSHDH